MPDHTVTIDETATPATIEFSPVFNVAVPMIDRHLEAGRGGKVAFRTAREEVTYAALAERVNRAGNALLELGVGPGERVLMVVTDTPEFVYLLFGAIKAGAIPVAVNTLLYPADYTHFVDDSECRLLCLSPELAPVVAEGLAQARHAPAHVISTEGEGGLAERMARAPATLAPAPAAPTDDCFWLYSSGSTGSPKGVVHAHRDMVVTSQRYAVETLGLREDDTVFSMSKLFHSYGFGNAMTFPLWVGATVVLTDDRVSAPMTFEIFERFRPTVFFGVPTLYAQQLRLLETEEPDLSSLRLWVSAGEALPPDIFRRWRERTGMVLLDGIGSTEVLHIFISNREADCRPGTSGQPVPGYEIRLLDENRDPVPAGEIGTIHVRGDSCAKYYWNNPEKTARTMVGDWLDTGDMYTQDDDGYYVNCGRGDDMLKVGGLWCSPFEIEARLIEHPAVLEAAVVARADDDGLIKPEAFVVPNDPGAAGERLGDQLRDHCRAGLAHYKYPRWFSFVDELPKTATGKIQRFRLRERD